MKDDFSRPTSGFEAILARVNDRAADAVMGKGRVRSRALRAELSARLHGQAGKPDAFVADPVFEAARDWQRADDCLEDLAGKILEEDLVAALDRETLDDGTKNTRRWPRRGDGVAPYVHQLRAWEAAQAGRSFMVTSGTGSGKTECFMIPMLNDLLRSHKPGQTGVRAIVLYPLNALIDSQKERLGAWMDPLADRLSYALYNRHLPDTIQGKKQRGAQLLERRAMRAAPPALMVTNVTMLEYMLMRAQDRPILEESQGTLRWIVLDEAHSYVGAQAAEMALLLRRVREAFGVAPGDVRLAATSATIGEGEENRETLRGFLADLAGLRPAQVEVIEGQERSPRLPPEGPDAPIDLDALPASSEALWDRLAPHPRVRKLRAAMRDGGVGLGEAERLLGREGDAEGTLHLIEAAAQATDPETGVALAPWRLHVFHRAQGGLWTCVDPECSKRGAALKDESADWPFGQVFLSERELCDCGAPVLEIAACDECGTPWLRAEVANQGPHRILRLAKASGADDDYILDVEPEDDADRDRPLLSESVVVGPEGAGGGEALRLSDAHLFEHPPEGDLVVRLTILSEADRGCCERAAHAGVAVRPQRFGAPFLMGNAMPLLIEAAKPSTHDHPVPFGGRRLLSFTDSRQGTARFSAKLQQDAERTLTRAIVYHSVQERSGDPEKADKLRAEITSLEEIVATMPTLQATLDEKRVALAEAEGAPKPFEWPDMVQRIAQNQEFCTFARPVWRDRPAKGDNALATDSTALAELFLYREFFRRPRLQNNAETMGLARLLFPGLVAQARLTVPHPLREAGHDADVWSDLLHAAVDMTFRTNLAIVLPETPADVRHWISPRSSVSLIVEPGLSRDNASGLQNPRFFPNALADRSNLVRLVYRLIGGDKDSATDQERAGQVLATLWETLRKAQVMTQVAASAWRLEMKKASIAPLEQAFECPVTRRLLPFAPAGVSLNAVADPATVRSIKMPAMPDAAPMGTSAAQRVALRDWLEHDETVADLRLDGHWTDLHDRTVEFTPFLRAQEHSAQIDRPSLQTYEDAFREGRINVLNCSTTMEMGVDIPDVGLVVNTNVPPSPANYRQRIGRAGRRGEPWAMAFTFCKDLPLDNMIFREPARLLRAQVAAPQVRLDSAILVQRHVNAALLGLFLRETGGTSVRTNMASFMGATDTPEAPFMPDSMADAFLEALKGDWGARDGVAMALERLVQGTCLAERSGLVARTEGDFTRMRDRWRDEYEQLTQAQAAYPDTDPAHWLYRKRAKRMREEFMMTELARRGFTPSYGFPVDVVSFDHAGTGGKGEAGPSRPLDMAIREYSPGCEVVIDGLVHRSDGVLPTWGNRNDPGSVEDLRTLFTCRSCNLFGTTRHDAANCPRCGKPLDRTELLRPSGFLGTRRPHSAYEQLAYVPPDPPRVSAEPETWVALPDPEVGRHRTAREGRVLVTASGENGDGYAVCITCGRAEAEISDGDVPLPSGMIRHWPLQRLRNNHRHDGLCPANDDASRKIRRHVKLGTEMTTDVFELQLDALPATEAGRAQAAAIGAGLREALAAKLGVDAETMGLTVAPSLRPDTARRSSVIIYDKASGGSGFVSAAERDLAGLLRATAGRLDCPAACTGGCPECVLRRDLQFATALDRPGALEVLRAEVLPRLDLPETLRLFGPETRAITRPLALWLDRQIGSGALKRLRLFLTDPPSGWDVAEWPGMQVAEAARRASVPVEIVLRAADIQKLEMSHKLDLVRLVTRADATLHLAEALPVAGEAAILAEGQMDGANISLASPDPEAAHIDRHWGEGARALMVRGPCAPVEISKPLSLSKVTAFGEGSAAASDVTTELDGPAAQFGRGLWKIAKGLRPQVFATDATLETVTYNDRYLRSPLTARLLFEAWRTLPFRTDSTRLSIVTEALREEGRSGTALHHNWDSDRLRRSVLSALFPGAQVTLGTKADCAHARFFRLSFADGSEVSLFLDQGFGAWREASRRGTRFDHDASPEGQARALTALRFDVAMQESGRFPSPIWLRW